MTDSKQEPKIIDGFDYLEFLIDEEWKRIPSQGMLEALIHFPKPDALDPYRLDHYRQKFELRNRKYDSEENQQILRVASNQLINLFVKHWESALPHSLKYIPKIKYITHPFEVDASKFYFSIDGNTPYCNHTPHDFSPNGSTRIPSEGVAKIIQWFSDNKLSYEKYLYAELMSHYCFHILPMTTSRYTAISGKLEIAERKSALGIELEDDERSYLEKTELFVASLQRRFSDFRDILEEYKETRQQMSQDKNIRYILDDSLNETAKQIRKDKANKSRIEEELELEIEIVSQCIFCYKFHYQTTKKRATKKGKSDKDKGGKGKTSLTRYCPDCERYCHQWADDKYTPDRRGIPLNGW